MARLEAAALCAGLFLSGTLPAVVAAEGRPLARADAEALALARNPEIAAMDAGVRAAVGAADQARALPNPSLNAEVEDFGGDLHGLGQSQVTYSVEQVLQTGGKRAARTRERSRALDVSRAELDARRRELVAETQRRFTRCLGLQERARSEDAALETASSIAATVRELVRAGEASGIEELRARNEAALARIERDGSLADLALARRDLAALWGGSPDEFGPLAGTLDVPVEVPPLPALLDRLASAPDTVRAAHEVARLDATLDLARRGRWPDLGLQLGLRQIRESRTRTYVAAIAIPLPLFDRNAGAIREAGANAERGRRERDGVSARLRAELGASYDRLLAAKAQLSVLQGELVPNAQHVLDSYAEGYRRGKFRLLDLLDARRTLFAAELRVIEAQVQLGLAHADLTRLAGPLPQE